MENVTDKFEMTDSMKMVQSAARTFAEKEIKPLVMKYDESQEFPFEIMKTTWRAGIFGSHFSGRVRRRRFRLS